MRTFLAIDLSPHIKDALSEIEKDLQCLDLDAAWVASGNLHMTLKFLGEIDTAQLPQIIKIMGIVGHEYESFQAKTSGFGFFPHQRRPKVFYLATDQEIRLSAIAQSLEDKLEGLGFAKEGRFRSHITLARIKTKKNIEKLKDSYAAITPDLTIEINAITLFKSTLKNTGPVYEVIWKENLKNCNIAHA